MNEAMTMRGSESPRRGLTLIELLCALALLAVMISGLSSWLGIAIRNAPVATERMRFERTAQAALNRIADDLLTGDFAGARHDEPSIRVQPHSLTVHTRTLGLKRAGDAARHLYEVQEGKLILMESRTAEPMSTTRRVLGSFAEIHFLLVTDADRIESQGVLRIELVAQSGDRLTRTVRWRR
jgi:prepilin-type N-terminal cleavage/methylation domain-containing protein